MRAELAVLYEAFPAAVGGVRDRLGPDASAAAGIDAFIVGAHLAPAAARRARQGLRALIEAESAGLPERQSLAWMWNEIEYGGDYFGDLPDGGYTSVVRALAEGVDVRRNVVVTDVEVQADGVRVVDAAGGVESGSHVVVTVPLGVLKDARPRFSPALPPDRAAAIERMGFGYFEKVVLGFDEPFWREAGLPHMMLFPADPAESTVWAIGQDTPDGAAILTFFVFHSVACRLVEAGPDQSAAWAVGLLTGAIGAPPPNPTAFAVSSWARDVHSLGAYSHITPEATPVDADLLGQPLHGRVQFAGEHTQSRRLAYADGAMASGIREAKRLLQQRHVTLGRIGCRDT